MHRRPPVRPILLTVVLLLVLAPARGAAPPGRLTAAQQRRLGEAELAFRQAHALLGQGDAAGFIEQGQRALAQERAVLGTTPHRRLPWLRGMARALEAGAQFPTAERLRLEAVEVLRGVYGADDWRSIDARLDLEDCRLLARLAPVARQKALQANSLNRQVIQRWQQGQSASALPLARQALTLSREAFGPRHRITAQSLHNLALLARATDELREALSLSQQALQIRKESLGERHPSYATSLNNLALLYQDAGQPRQALPLHQRALLIRRATLGEQHADYASSLNTLAAVYQDLGQHQQALNLFQRALPLYKAALGENHSLYANGLNDLANLYREMGDHKQALSLLQQALLIRIKALGENHPHSIASLINLAVVHQHMGEQQQALTRYRQALQISKAALGENHHASVTCLSNLAALHREMGEHRQALTLSRQVLQIRKEALGEKHPGYATSLHNLAKLYQDMGQPRQALALSRQVLQICKQTLGEKHPHYATTLENLAALSAAMGKSKEAAAQCTEVLEVWRGYLEDNLASFSQRQRARRLAQLAGTLNLRLSTALDSAGAAELYQAALVYKGLSASRSTEQILALRQPRLASLLADLRLARADLARHAARLPGRDALIQWKKRFDELEARKEALEVKLSQASDAFRLLGAKPTAQAVAAALPADAALIEFLAYTHYTFSHALKGKYSTQRRLLAWVLRRGREPALVRLGEAGPIEQALRRWRLDTTDQNRGREKPLPPLRAPAGSTEAGAMLRDRVWLPLTRHLGGAKTVVICPMGSWRGCPSVPCRAASREPTCSRNTPSPTSPPAGNCSCRRPQRSRPGDCWLWASSTLASQR
jgi:hypothetical protein